MRNQALQTDLFGMPNPSTARKPQALTAASLSGWQPGHWQVAPDWRSTVDPFFESEAGQSLAQFVTERLASGVPIYPPEPLRALALTPLAEVKVVIVGQDPYHGPGQAEGLAFSVGEGQRIPPSLRNMYKELEREALEAAPGIAPNPRTATGSLVRWAREGVLLLNTCLTVEKAQPASHANRGWEVLTDAVIDAVLGKKKPVVFLLWGAHAQKLSPRIQAAPGRHLVLVANHPSPLSALRPPAPFIGCGHFGQANQWLVQEGSMAVVW